MRGPGCDMWANDMEHPSLQALCWPRYDTSHSSRIGHGIREYLPGGHGRIRRFKVASSCSPADWSWSFARDPLKVQPSGRDGCIDHCTSRSESESPAAVKHLLDEHVTFSIASLLSAEDLTSMAVVCKSIHDVVCRTHAFDTNVWKHLPM